MLTKTLGALALALSLFCCSQQASSCTEAGSPMALTPYSSNPAGPSGTGVQLTFNLPTDGDNWTASEINAFNQQAADDIACIATSLNNIVTSVAALRALPVPVNPNGLAYVLLTPELNGNQVGNGGLYASTFSGTFIGGIYYYDSGYTAVGDSSTCIQPTAVTGSNPGRWRLQKAAPALVWDQYYDSTLGNNGSLTAYQVTAVADSNNRPFIRSGTGPGFYILNLSTGSGPQAIYLDDVIDGEATITVGIGSGFAQTTTQWIMNGVSSGGFITGTTVGAQTFLGRTTTSAFAEANSIKIRFRYIVQSSDITAGTLTFQPVFAQISGGTSTVGAQLQDVKITIRRP